MRQSRFKFRVLQPVTTKLHLLPTAILTDNAVKQVRKFSFSRYMMSDAFGINLLKTSDLVGQFYTFLYAPQQIFMEIYRPTNKQWL